MGFKKTIAMAVTVAWLLAPTAFVRGSNKPVDYEYLDSNKKVIERVDYQTFRNNLDLKVVKQKIENQDSFAEMIIKEINTNVWLREDRGINFRRGVNEEEFSNFIFDDILKKKLNYEIKTPADLIIGLNVALEYLGTYNNKMALEEQGLGSDVNDDGRFDGIKGSYFEKVDKKLQKEIMKNPEKGIKVAQKECEKVDNTPTDMLLMGMEEIKMDTNTNGFDGYTSLKFIRVSKKKGEPNSVDIVCRNYMSALQIMFETSKKRYPELTKDLDLLQMPMPGHIFGAFINKKTLEYIVVDPTVHDGGEVFDSSTLVWPSNEQFHYDCLKNEALFQTLKFEKDLNAYSEKFSSESFLSHKGSKKMLKELVPKIRELVKKYPNSKELASMEARTYMGFIQLKDYSKAFNLLKSVYDNKEKKEKLDSYTQCLTLLLLGELAFELKDYKQALPYYQECSRIRLAENSFADEAMLGVAKTNFELKNYYEALFRAKDVLELLPEHYRDLRKEAKKVVSESAKKIWSSERRKELSDYIEGDYKKFMKNLASKDDETRLLLAESYASLNRYEEAKNIYKDLVKKDNKTIADFAQSEMEQMNRKFYIYGYMHFFDSKFKKVIDEFEFLKSQITPQDKVAEKVSLFLIWSYDTEKQTAKALEESGYFLKNFPNSEFRKGVEEYIKNG